MIPGRSRSSQPIMVVGTEEEKAITVVDWLQLPKELTSHIMSKLISISDYAIFRVVCVKWRSIFDDHHCRPTFKFPRQLPLLIIPPPSLPPHKNDKKKMVNMMMKKNGHWNHATTTTTTKSCSFYRITDGKIYNRLHLTLPSDRYYRGSSYGWLITVDNDDLIYPAQLINPFFTTNNEIKLPPLTAHPFSKGKDPVHGYDHLRKAILSADPAVSNPKDITVMAVFGNHTTLAFCKPGDEAWTSINDDIKGLFQDVMYYKDMFYALHYKGSVLVCDVEKQTATTIVGPPVTEFKSYKKYLVESFGECFQVHRLVTDSHRYSTTRFKVFKLLSSLDPTERMMISEEPVDWVEVSDLCDHTFFLGDNVAMSILAFDFPGCKPNCIYFTDDYNEGYCVSNSGPHDMGVYNLVDGSFEQHYPTKFNSQIWPPPIWIEPTLPRISNIRHSKHNII